MPNDVVCAIAKLCLEVAGMRDKAHDELAATVTTDSADPIPRALDRHAETAARVLLRTRPGRCDRPSGVSRPAPAQPEQRLGGGEDKDWSNRQPR